MLATLAFKMVNIDPATRGVSVPIPDSVLQDAQQKLIPNGVTFPRVESPSALPEKVFTIQIEVRYDDMDFLFHTNQSSYLEFALECASHAAESGFYTEIHEDVAFHRVKQLTAINLEESQVGDQLTVSTWEDTNNKLLMHFAVKNKDDQVIYYTQLEFYPE